MPISPRDDVYPIYQKGTAFPGSPLTNDRFFRTDRGIEYYYDGTRWVSINEYAITLGGFTYNASNVLSVTNTNVFIAPSPSANGTPAGGATQVWVTKCVHSFNIGATNDASNRWNIVLGTRVAETIASLDTGTPVDYPTGWNRVEATVGSVWTVATDVFWIYGATKIASASNLQLNTPVIHYRLIR